MLNRIRNPIAICVLSLTLIAAACPKTVDVLQKLSNVVSLFEPFVQSLGIVPEQLKPILADAKDISKVASDLASEMNVATTRSEKFAAADKAQKAMLLIVNRNHFQVDPRVMNVVTLISAAFSSVVNFYSDLPKAGPAMSEKAFAQKLDADLDKIKRQMGH
jgi:hypothetical protein